MSYSTSGSTGYISPSGQSADGTGFNNPTNAYSDGGSSAATAKNNYRNRFTYTMPSLPAGASITGIQVRPDWWLDSTSGTNSVDVELSWNGGTTWTSKKNESTESTNDTNNKTLGGSTDNWGHTWSISDISSTNFRVRITANSSSSSRTISLDWIPVNVFYAIPGVPSNLTPTAPGSYNYWLANTGSAVNAVNGNDGDTTYIDEADKQTFAFAGAGVPSNATVNSVTLNVVAKSYNGSSATMQLITENGSNQTNDNGHSLSTSYATYQYNNGPMTINPLTGSAWTVSEVNNWTTKFGVQKTSNGTSVPRVTQMYLTVSYSTPTTLSTTCQLGVDLSYDGGSHWVSPQKTQTLTSTLTQLPSFGGSTDNWYRTWAPGDFSNSNFRVRVQDIDPGIGCNSNAVTNLDWLQARVYYSTTTIDTATENTDGDNFYISPTSADMAGIFTDIGKRVCPSNQIVTPPDPPTKGTLMIMTKVNNNNGGSKTESNFTVKVTGDSPSQTSFAGSSAGTSVTVDPGAYNVTENSMSGYIFTPGATCSSSGSLGNIVAGETRVCILNNDDIPPPPPPPDLNFDPNSWHEVPTAN